MLTYLHWRKKQTPGTGRSRPRDLYHAEFNGWLVDQIQPSVCFAPNPSSWLLVGVVVDRRRQCWAGEAANPEIKDYASFLINSSPRKNFPKWISSSCSFSHKWISNSSCSVFYKWISNSGCSLLFPKVDQQLQAQLMKH